MYKPNFTAFEAKTKEELKADNHNLNIELNNFLSSKGANISNLEKLTEKEMAFAADLIEGINTIQRRIASM